MLSAEDKRFFEHPGFDLIRIMGAAWADLRHDARAQGASTLTMQVSRSFFFTTERTWRRKLAETMVSLELEHRFTKQQIFELYANEIYLGNRGSFGIHGFAEGSLAYFNTDIHDITLGEAAFLAWRIIRAPNRYSSSDQHPERAIEARDSRADADGHQWLHHGEAGERRQARAAASGSRRAGEQRRALLCGYGEGPSARSLLGSATSCSRGVSCIYTTLDPEIPSAQRARRAISIGIANIDQQLATRRYCARWQKQGMPAIAQVGADRS